MNDKLSSLKRSNLSDFEILKKLGQGAQGNVFQVRRQVDNLVYVMKQISTASMSVNEQKQAINEAILLHRMENQYIVKYHDSFLENNILSIIMEYCDGGDLDSFIRHQMGRPISEKQIWKFFLQMSLGLYHLHKNGILHRDIQSMNIYLTGNENIRIGDLGIAKQLVKNATHAHSQVGTPYYMSPEVCLEKPYNDKSDVWSMGVVLYELCTFQRPFEGQNGMMLLNKIIKGNYLPISNFYSNELIEMIDLCLKKDVNLRISSQAITQHPVFKQQMKLVGIEAISNQGKQIIPVQVEHSLTQQSFFPSRNRVDGTQSPPRRELSNQKEYAPSCPVISDKTFDRPQFLKPLNLQVEGIQNMKRYSENTNRRQYQGSMRDEINQIEQTQIDEYRLKSPSEGGGRYSRTQKSTFQYTEKPSAQNSLYIQNSTKGLDLGEGIIKSSSISDKAKVMGITNSFDFLKGKMGSTQQESKIKNVSILKQREHLSNMEAIKIQESMIGVRSPFNILENKPSQMIPNPMVNIIYSNSHMNNNSNFNNSSLINPTNTSTYMNYNNNNNNNNHNTNNPNILIQNNNGYTNGGALNLGNNLNSYKISTTGSQIENTEIEDKDKWVGSKQLMKFQKVNESIFLQKIASKELQTNSLKFQRSSQNNSQNQIKIDTDQATTMKKVASIHHFFLKQDFLQIDDKKFEEGTLKFKNLYQSIEKSIGEQQTMEFSTTSLTYEDQFELEEMIQMHLKGLPNSTAIIYDLHKLIKIQADMQVFKKKK